MNPKLTPLPVSSDTISRTFHLPHSTMTSVLEVNPKMQPQGAISSKAAICLGVGVAVVGAASFASLGMIAAVASDVSDLSAAATAETPASAEHGGVFAGDNYCAGTKPTSGWDNIECVNTAIEQAGGDVTMTTNANGVETFAAGDITGDSNLITQQFYKKGLCPVNVHWHLGAEHRSTGQFDDAGTVADRGPSDSAHRKLLATTDSANLRCYHYDATDAKFTTEFDWKHCVGMKVGETYEVHWPHSAFGACATVNQYQTPFYDGVFCNMNATTAASLNSAAQGDIAVVGTAQQIGVQSQVFTIVNDESYYYPDLIRGMIVDGDKGTQITAYTGSTTGTTRSNTMCSTYGPISWHVDRTCHMISASTFDKMCADMKAQRDDMSDDLYAHGSREVVNQANQAANQRNLYSTYQFEGAGN